MSRLIQYKQWLLDNPICLICKNPIDLTEDDNCKWIAFTKKKLRNGFTVFKDFYCIDCYMKSVRRAIVRDLVNPYGGKSYSQISIDDFIGEI